MYWVGALGDEVRVEEVAVPGKLWLVGRRGRDCWSGLVWFAWAVGFVCFRSKWKTLFGGGRGGTPAGASLEKFTSSNRIPLPSPYKPHFPIAAKGGTPAGAAPTLFQNLN